MLYYHCCCCQMAMTGSSLCPSFLHRITNARSFTVVHLLMMVVIVICICINIYIGTIRSSFPSRIITTLSFQAVMYILVVVMDEIYIYIYIYIYIWVYFVCDTILYDGVVLVQMTWYRLFTLSIVCWVSPYLQRIGTTRSFFIVVGADDDVYIVMSVSICSHKDNYYTIIPSLYDQFGDSVDCSI